MANVTHITILVSSVIEDFDDFRDAVLDVATRLNLEGYRFNVLRVDKELPASNSNPLEACYEGVDRSDICLSILGPRYGYVHPETNLSISEMEFDRAVTRKRPILVFVLDCEMDVKQQAFKQKVEDIVTGKFRKKVATIGDLKYECDQALRQWDATKPAEGLAQAFLSYSSNLLDGITSELPAPIGRLLRPEVDRVLDLLSTEDSVLLTGERGTGKSGVLKAVCERANDEGIPILALAPATTAYPRGADSLTFLEQSLSLGTTSLAGALFDIADSFGRVYLVVDQLDFVKGTDLGRTLVHLLLSVDRNPRVSVLAACRTFDSQQDELLALRAARFTTVEVSQLPPAQVRTLLVRAGMRDEPTDELVQLGSNLLLLSLIVDLIRKGRSLESLVEDIDLWGSYTESIRATEGEEAFARALALAKEGLLEGKTDLAPSLPLDVPTQRLISAGILTQMPFDRVRFRHEELQFFLYAWDVIRNGFGASDIAGELTPQIARGVLPYIHRLKRAQGPDHEASLLREVFEVPDV